MDMHSRVVNREKYRLRASLRVCPPPHPTNAHLWEGGTGRYYRRAFSSIPHPTAPHNPTLPMHFAVALALAVCCIPPTGGGVAATPATSSNSQHPTSDPSSLVGTRPPLTEELLFGDTLRAFGELGANVHHRTLPLPGGVKQTRVGFFHDSAEMGAFLDRQAGGTDLLSHVVLYGYPRFHLGKNLSPQDQTVVDLMLQKFPKRSSRTQGPRYMLTLDSSSLCDPSPLPPTDSKARGGGGEWPVVGVLQQLLHFFGRGPRQRAHGVVLPVTECNVQGKHEERDFHFSEKILLLALAASKQGYGFALSVDERVDALAPGLVDVLKDTDIRQLIEFINVRQYDHSGKDAGRSTGWLQNVAATVQHISDKGYPTHQLTVQVPMLVLHEGREISYHQLWSLLTNGGSSSHRFQRTENFHGKSGLFCELVQIPVSEKGGNGGVQQKGTDTVVPNIKRMVGGRAAFHHSWPTYL